MRVAAMGFFSLLPPARIRAWKDLSEIVRRGLQVPFFREVEIITLDRGILPKLCRIGRKPPFLWLPKD
jgi:hypothetical protein